MQKLVYNNEIIEGFLIDELGNIKNIKTNHMQENLVFLL